jgi:hypothetical protein
MGGIVMNRPVKKCLIASIAPEMTVRTRSLFHSFQSQETPISSQKTEGSKRKKRNHFENTHGSV